MPAQTRNVGSAEKYVICSRCDPAHESQVLPGTDQYDAVELRSYRDVRETAPPKPATATTLLISINPDTLFVRQGYTFYVHTRYQRYIGDFVLHCHILDHEDKGMMQNVSIGIPDGRRSQH